MLRVIAHFYSASRCFGLALVGAFVCDFAGAVETVPLRLVAANLSSGNFQSYDLPSVSAGGEGARILAGLAADIVMLQEFNYRGNTASELRTFVDATFGPDFSYYRESGAQIPNGIVSRYPILASGEWDDPEVTNRDFAYARIDIPGAVDLWVISVHLLTDTSRHSAEGDALLSLINANVPARDLLAIAGDFNSTVRTDAALTKLAAVVKTSGPYPVDQNGNAFTNAGRNNPYDGVYADLDLSAFSTSTVIGSTSFANGAVIDTRVFNSSSITSISPARQADSAGANMQHMAIVRDFAVPVPEPGAVTLLSGSLLILACRRRTRSSRGQRN